MNSDSSSYYVTTYSTDERIETELREERRLRELEAAKLDEARYELFENYWKSDLPVFKAPGIEFHIFGHLKIKFSFRPRALTSVVNKNVRFFISLKYKGKNWRVKRDSLPVNYKWKVYNLFFTEKSFAVDDENIFEVIKKIHEILVVWTLKEKQFRLDKMKRYREGEDMELDTDDEQIFLSQDERIELYQRRTKVLKRMMPPKK